jgi:hypothetical protein
MITNKMEEEASIPYSCPTDLHHSHHRIAAADQFLTLGTLVQR